ncbi:MAG TPA: amidohydrolase [Longimicrobiales bacterium]|nr:amidohydrolase [Longimicrobiales bacterium]
MTGKAVLRLGLAVLAAAGCSTDGPAEEPADLVLRGGHVVTVDSTQPEAEAIAVRGHTIVAVGTDEEIERFIGAGTQVIELNGRLAMPGFIEGHGHFPGLGQKLMNLDLMTVKNWDEIVAMVGAAAADAKADAWIIGRGWHQEKWDRVPEPNVEGVPLHTSLDAVSPNNPVLLTHASGHASFANKRALDLAGITRSTPNPPGGEIVKDARGEPTGLLRETASGLVSRARSRSESGRAAADVEAENRRAVELAAHESLAKGITSFQDAGSSFATVDFLKRLEAEGALPLRLYVMIRASNDQLEQRLPEYLMPAEGNDFLTVRAIKVTMDGALGSHGAWLLEPYDDMPNSTGLATTQPATLARTAELAMQHGFQLNVHAIGDRGNREVLNVFENAFQANPDKTALRWRIEHAQHLHPTDIPRFGQLGVIPAMQGVHATSDGPWIPKRLGEQRAREGAYVWRGLIDSGASIANGTDAPVEDVDPIASFYSSVSRRMNTGEVFYPEQRMTREEALRSYTINNAFAAFEEDIKGSLTVGKLADIVVLSKDIMTIPEAEIPTARVDLTIVGGQIRYQRATQVTTNR